MLQQLSDFSSIPYISVQYMTDYLTFFKYLFLFEQIYICVGLSGIPAATVVEAANEVALQGGSSKELPHNINLGGKKWNIIKLKK